MVRTKKKRLEMVIDRWNYNGQGRKKKRETRNIRCVVYVRAVKRLCVNQSRATGQQTRAIRPSRRFFNGFEKQTNKRRRQFKRRESWKSYQYRKRRKKEQIQLWSSYDSYWISPCKSFLDQWCAGGLSLIRGNRRLAARLAVEVVEGNVQQFHQFGQTRLVVRVNEAVPDEKV